MQTPVICTANTALSAAGVRHLGPVGGAAPSSGNTVRIPLAEAGVLSNLVVRLSSALTTGQYAVVVQKGSGGSGAPADTSVTVTLASGDQVKTDAVNTATFAAGDTLLIKFTPSSTPDVVTPQVSFIYTATATGKSVIFAQHVSGSTATFMGLGTSPGNATETSVTVVAPTDGVISKLYAFRGAAPGAGTSVTYTLRQGVAGAAPSDTALAATISNTAVDANGTGTVNVAAGDFLTIGVTVSGAPAAAIGAVCLDWAPSTDGEALLFGTTTTAANTATRYLNENGSIINATESTAYAISPGSFSLKKMYARVTTAPGSGKSWAFKVRIGAADKTLTASIVDTNTTATPDTTHTDTLAANDLFDLSVVPSGTPTAYGAVNVATVIAAITGVTQRTLTLLGVG